MGLSAGAIIGVIVLTVLGVRRAKQKYGNDVQAAWIDSNVAPFHGFGPFGWMLIVMMVLTVVSLIPLPLGLIDILSPSAADWYREAWQLAGIDRSWGFLTAAWGRTAFALWGLVGYWAVYVMTMRLCGTRENVQHISHALAIVGVIFLGMMGLKYLGHPLSIGRSGEMAAWHIGFPVNSNHAAGIAAVLSIIFLGNFLTKRHHHAAARRGLWLLLYILLGAAVVLLKSRGALFAWGCGHIFVFLYAAAVSKQLKWKTGVVILAAAMGVIVAVLFVASSTLTEIKTEIAETNIVFSTTDTQDEQDAVSVDVGKMSKTQMYGDFLEMGKDWGRAGTGRSAFSDVYPAYQGFAFQKHFRHAENEYWEIILEYGWFWGTICLLLGAFGIGLFLKDFWKAKDERNLLFGILAAVFVLIIQNFFDFSLRYWSTGMLFWLSCGILEGRRHRWKYGRIVEDHAKISKKRTIEWCAGNALFVVACVTAFVVMYGAYDGQSQIGIRELRYAAASNLTHNKKVTVSLEDNLVTRAGNFHIRDIMAKALVGEGINNKTLREHLWKEAEAWYRSAATKNPWDAETSIHLAKLCLISGDFDCASRYFIKTAENDPRKLGTAMWELSSMKLEEMQIPESWDAFSSLVISLMDRRRYDDAQVLISERQKTDPVHAAGLLCSLYVRLNMDDGCDLVLNNLDDEEMSIYLFDLKWNAMVRREQYEELFDFMEKYEAALNNEVLYWEHRLRASVFWGQMKGDEWYRNQVPAIFNKFRQVGTNSLRWRLAFDYYDAKYALNLGLYGRAVRSANLVLAIRPSHKGAITVLNAAEQAQNLKKKSAGGL